MKQYEHTQTGYVMITVMIGVMIFIGITMANTGFEWNPAMILILIGVLLVQFYNLTVIIKENNLEVRFGPGLIRKKFRLQDIESCRVVRNSWYNGWGIRLTPHGWLFSVSGFSAVEIRLKSGRTYRIGTDVPHELERAIQQAIQT
ncbi:hypothetical protein ACFLWR_01810 [Chloroflexota bacterium]